MEPTSVKYRPDIDGLRALAVIPVVWFHSDLPGLPGGFTGVDTFFVISGYLITLIIHREMNSGSFRFSHFYERRFRRIAPALVTVLATSSVAAFGLLLPYELGEFARAEAAAMAMVSNIFFWRTGGYFALADYVVPLLHTWSLGVEEQFYLLFPAILFAASRIGVPRRTVAAIAAISFALSIVGTVLSPAATFYLLPTRAWELMIGASLALGLVHVPRRVREGAGWVGVVLLILAVLFIASSDPFPGWRALLPAIGAALIIGSGPQTRIGGILASAPLRYVGKISYSLYLWHWPVFVFLRHWQAATHLSVSLALGGVALSFALSAASYRYIEQPARKRSTRFRSVILACTAAAAAILASILLALTTNGLPGRLPASVVSVASRHFAGAPLSHSCTDAGFATALHRCRIGPPGPTSFIVWGDSHASAVSEGVALGLDRGGVIMSASACPPSGNWISPGLRGRDIAACRKLNRETLGFIDRHPAVSTVVLSAYWSQYERLGERAFWNGIQQTIDRLRLRGKVVILLSGIPDPGSDVPWASAINLRFGRPPIRLNCAVPDPPVRDVLVVNEAAAFCRYPADLLFTDSNHVSRFAGLKIVAPAVRAALAKQAAMARP